LLEGLVLPGRGSDYAAVVHTLRVPGDRPDENRERLLLLSSASFATIRNVPESLAGRRDSIFVYGARYIATTLNRDIRDLVSHSLPLLTQGRHEHLKVDENLDVQVFSSDKRDFMQFEEISTGTQRQIMLAVRLALSQQFINTTLNRQQFIFLDEPFAFFDEPRTRSALQSLPKLSDELTQIWIVAQAFPAGFAFDLEVRCGQGREVLILPPIC
jgi:ABC-type glutathione transport system ATPase component